ncbi:hypothetical protein DCAR_0624512 [Daucus carota subsp. sativus]|uniref:Uncharacterized protein n=1 Tax=Daucus carota subsp. sativus TaxID=79200 RepID=A0AAF0XDP7_DAUCS|nr:hypothetical protein DCAR_0624512 [Daucus carota subsp. sativus]
MIIYVFGALVSPKQVCRFVAAVLSNHEIKYIIESVQIYNCIDINMHRYKYIIASLFLKQIVSSFTKFGMEMQPYFEAFSSFTLKNVIAFAFCCPHVLSFLFLKSVDSLDACIYAEIRTRIPETISWDYNFEPAGSTPLSFTSEALKEAIDDLEWPGSSIQVSLQPAPPVVTFRGEGHGDLQVKLKFGSLFFLRIDFMYYANTDLLTAFHCDRQESHRYKYKFLRATTSNIPSSVIKENRGSKLTIGRGGMSKVQHLVSVAKPSNSHSHADSAGYLQPSRIAYIEFFVKPEVEDDNADD